MKKILFLALLFCTSFLFADPIEDFSLADANRIVDFLKENPFMIDYCDCCNDVLSEGEAPIQAKLIRIVEREIVPCEYDASRYSIRITAEILATGVIENKKMSSLRVLPRDEAEEYNTLLSANYFFCADKRKIGQLGMITQDDKLYKEYNCGGVAAFPAPSELTNIISMEQYVKWYRKNARE